MNNVSSGLYEVNACYPPHNKQCIHSLSFSLASRGITCLLGESGSGKTTIVRLLAGFMRPCGGTVRVSEEVVASAAAWVPPEERSVGVLFQDYALFPHLTVEENILFGVSTKDKTQRAKILRDMLEVCDLGAFNLSRRYPHELSGGQMQRIALARCIASRPRVLILDEPFNTIGVDLRGRMIAHLQSVVQNFDMQVLYITHEKNESFAVGDSLAVIKDGRLLQQGSARDVYDTPVNSYVARYFDPVNLISVQRVGDGLHTALGVFPTTAVEIDNERADSTRLCVRPRQVCFYPQNCKSISAPARVMSVRYYGGYYEVCCESSTDMSATGSTETITVWCDEHPPRVESVVNVGLQVRLQQFHHQKHGENRLHVLYE